MAVPFLVSATSNKAPIGWEVVQLVGLQTLDLAILVRVQASQPKFIYGFMAVAGRGPLRLRDGFLFLSKAASNPITTGKAREWMLLMRARLVMLLK